MTAGAALPIMLVLVAAAVCAAVWLWSLVRSRAPYRRLRWLLLGLRGRVTPMGAREPDGQPWPGVADRRADARLVPWRRLLRRRLSPQWTIEPLSPTRDVQAVSPQWSLARPISGDGPWLAIGLRALAGLIAAVGCLGAGPVAGAVLLCYGLAAAVIAVRRQQRRLHHQSFAAAADAVCALATELRAGAPPTIASTIDRGVIRGPAALAVLNRIDAAVSVAERSGAPLAELLDRLDNHLRAISRAQAMVAAQAAGANASAALLFVMPIGGAGLGFLIGIDPLRILLHTSIGGACLMAAVLLQLAGLAWADRLARIEVAL